MRIAICDDEITFANEIKEKIESYYKSMDILINIYHNPQKLLEDINEKPEYYQAVFLDIEMPQLDGMTLAKRIKDCNPELTILFLSSHAEQMDEGYEVNAFRFLTKPLQQKKLERALQALEVQQQSKRQITLKCDGENYLIQEKDILYIQADNIYLHVYTNTRKYMIREKLKNMETLLGTENFIRVHKSYLISYHAVNSYQKNSITLKNDIKIPLSRTYCDNSLKGMLAYSRRQAGC